MEPRECFVTCDEMHVVKHFNKTAINRRFNENCGIYWHNISDAQLIDYTWTKVREFFANSGRRLVGTLTTGRQPSMKKSNETGDLVAVEETELDGLQSWKDLVDDFDESVYIINEKMQVTKDYFSIMFTQLL